MIHKDDIFITRCLDRQLWDNPMLENSIEKLFNFEVVAGNISNESNGKVLTNCDINDLCLLDAPGINGLMEWMIPVLFDSKEKLDIKKEVNGIIFGRCWANKMFKGSNGICHRHNKYNNIDGVAIFYYRVPSQSSKFMLINCDKKNYDGKLESEIDKNDIVYIDVQEGDLILHDTNIFHAVSDHHNNDPRICFVFEFAYI
jgi:hypothetical protein